MKDHNFFGTDGVRGLANEYPMTSELIISLVRATARLMIQPGKHSNTNKPKVLVGKDPRLSSDMLEGAVISGFCSAGVDVLQVGVVPTPAIAYLTKLHTAQIGVMISASHNPYYDNGLKIFSSEGYKIDSELEHRISALAQNRDPKPLLPTGDQIGRVIPVSRAASHYVDYYLNLFKNISPLSEFSVALDCAHGASYKIAPKVLKKLGAQVHTLGISPNGKNINKLCGATCSQTVAKLTLQSRADIGISLDGDGDRCILSDENGELVDGDQIIGLTAIHLQSHGALKKSAVVVTPMSNIGLSASLADHQISVFQSDVGDRNVVDLVKTHGYSLGGEQSGHVVFHDISTTGDGLLTALRVLEVMKHTGKKLSQLKTSIRLFPQVRVDVRVKRKEPFEVHNNILQEINSAELALGKKGRVFVRYSGTEPVARVMVEGESLTQIDFLSKSIANRLQVELN